MVEGNQKSHVLVIFMGYAPCPTAIVHVAILSMSHVPIKSHMPCAFVYLPAFPMSMLPLPMVHTSQLSFKLFLYYLLRKFVCFTDYIAGGHLSCFAHKFPQSSYQIPPILQYRYNDLSIKLCVTSTCFRFPMA